MNTSYQKQGTVLPINKAEELAVKAIREVGLDGNQAQLISLIPSVCSFENARGDKFCRINDLQNLVLNFIKAIQTKDSSFLLQRRGLRVDRIVDIEEFLESPDYMNQKNYLRPRIKQGLLDLYSKDQYIEVVLGGAIGIGKTFFGDMAMAYMLYLLSCYHNPQLEYELAPGSSIIFIQQSITLKLAKKAVFEQFGERLKESPYFIKNFRYDPKVKSELRFPKNIFVLPIGGNDTNALGLNVYAGQIEEMNFMARTRDSIHVRYTSDDEYDQAERLYTTLSRRIKSRFMQKGRVPGKLILVSSANYSGDFIDRKVLESKTDDSIFVLRLSQWEALPSDRFSGETFLVEVGNDVKSSRIILSREEAQDEEDVIEVPIEYRTEFERDIDAALRDIGGISTGTRHPFIPYREKIVKAHEDFDGQSEGRQLFKYDSCILDNVIDVESPDWSLVVDKEYISDNILDTSQVFAGHIDVGITQNSAGLCFSRIVGYKSLPSTRYYNERLKTFVEIKDIQVPIYRADGVLQIVAPPNGEIDLELVRELVMYVKGIINIRWMTMDSYQSTMMIQSFKKAKIRSGVLSVDTSLAPYIETKLALNDERMLYPNHEVLKRELRELERHNDKVDHPPGGSKDCSDALAGSIFILQRKEARFSDSARTSRRRGTGTRTVSSEDEHEEVRVIRTSGSRTRYRGRTI